MPDQSNSTASEAEDQKLRLVQEYREKIGPKINSDNVKKLFEKYSIPKFLGTINFRKYINGRTYESYFFNPGGVAKIVLVVGGNYSGKSTFLNRHDIGKSYMEIDKPINEQHILCREVHFGDDENVNSCRINEIVERKIPLEIVFIFRPVSESVKSSVTSAMEPYNENSSYYDKVCDKISMLIRLTPPASAY